MQAPLRIRKYNGGLGLAMCLALLLAAACGDAPLEDGALAEPNAQEAGGEVPADSPRAVPLPGEDPELSTPVPREVPEPAVEGPACTPGGPGCDDVPLSANPATLYPTVLAHGMGGFDAFGPLEYWGGAEVGLRELGFEVYVAVVDPLNGSDVGAEQLSGFVDHVLECTCAEKINLIGHSQGGIDARVLINVMGYGDRIASATSIATPHRGSVVADQLLGLMPATAEGLVDLLGWMVAEIYTDPLEETSVKKALTWVSQTHLTQFEKDYPDDPQVTWYSYAGRAGITSNGKPECEGAALPNPKLKPPMNPPLLPGWTALGGFMGVDNDGLVTVESAKWGEFRGCIPADHVQEIGMFFGSPKLFDHHAFYRQHMEFLSSAGH